MPHLDAVLYVLERDYPATEFFRRSRALVWWEQVLQDLDDAFSEFGVEVVEDEVRVAFADCAAGGIGDVVAERDVVEGERGCGPVREVRDCERGGGPAVFVEEDCVGQTAGYAAFDQVGEDRVASV